jgi:glucosamine--fructose-6-phosphate aminotransferase (isomerizing)
LAGVERSVAATKSYICSLAAIAALVAAWSQDAALTNALGTLPARLDDAFALDWSPAVAAYRDATNLFVLGRGYGLGVAQEAALKFKETSALHAECFSAAEVRHGPMAIVGQGFHVLAAQTVLRSASAMWSPNFAVAARPSCSPIQRLATCPLSPRIRPSNRS